MKISCNTTMPWDKDFNPDSSPGGIFTFLKGRCRLGSSSKGKPQVGLVGHAGVAHAHGPSIVQDDSVGFGCIITLLRSVFPVDLRIAKVEGDPVSGRILLTTKSGGVGESFPRRGITPQEIDLLNRAVGCDASFCQSVACHAFGRIYGQGVLECPACLEASAAFATIDSFRRSWPDQIHIEEFEYDDNKDALLGATIEIDDISASLLAVVNFTSGGLGPNEDGEGNFSFGAKRDLMTRLGLENTPTIIVESKAYLPSYCNGLKERHLFTRANRQVDNMAVARALVNGARKADLPMVSDFDAYPRGRDLAKATSDFCDRINLLTLDLSHATSAAEKVRLIGELAIMVSQDAGAITFMSDKILSVAGTAGIAPGTAAVLSMIIPPIEANLWKIPVLFQKDLSQYIIAILGAIAELKCSFLFGCDDR